MSLWYTMIWEDVIQYYTYTYKMIYISTYITYTHISLYILVFMYTHIFIHVKIHVAIDYIEFLSPVSVLYRLILDLRVRKSPYTISRYIHVWVIFRFKTGHVGSIPKMSFSCSWSSFSNKTYPYWQLIVSLHFYKVALPKYKLI